MWPISANLLGDVIYCCMSEKLKLERKTENSVVSAKKRRSIKAVEGTLACIQRNDDELYSTCASPVLGDDFYV